MSQPTPTPSTSHKRKKQSEQCGVCAQAEGRYKCPRCRLPYCSVACCRTHKDTCGQQPPATGVSELLDDSGTGANSGTDTGGSDQVSDKVSELLDDSGTGTSTGGSDKVNELLDDAGSSSEAVTSTSSSTTAPLASPTVPTSSDGFDIITSLQKSQLVGSKEVCDYLKSKRLRDKIMEIDSAGSGRRDALKRARANPEFEQFLDVMLKAVQFRKQDKVEKC